MTFNFNHTELLDKYNQHYLVNIEDIYFSNIKLLCHYLDIQYLLHDPQSTMNNIVKALSDIYTDSLNILLCDEVDCWDSPDWSDMKTCHNVIWLMAINPNGNMKIVPPTSDDVLYKQLLVKYRNCHQIR